LRVAVTDPGPARRSGANQGIDLGPVSGYPWRRNVADLNTYPSRLDL